MKKTELQKEGYDVIRTKPDNVYFWTNGKYTPLMEDMYKTIVAGEMNL